MPGAIDCQGHGLVQQACLAHLARGDPAQGDQWLATAMWAAQSEADVRTVVDTARLKAGTSVLRRIADHPVSRLHELLPWNWKKLRLQAVAV